MLCIPGEKWIKPFLVYDVDWRSRVQQSDLVHLLHAHHWKPSAKRSTLVGERVLCICGRNKCNIMQWLLEVTVRAKREGVKIYVDRSHQGEVRGGAFVRTSV